MQTRFHKANKQTYRRNAVCPTQETRLSFYAFRHFVCVHVCVGDYTMCTLSVSFPLAPKVLYAYVLTEIRYIFLKLETTICEVSILYETKNTDTSWKLLPVVKGNALCKVCRVKRLFNRRSLDQINCPLLRRIWYLFQNVHKQINVTNVNTILHFTYNIK